MDFLKDILGDELYKQVESKVNEYNNSDDNKDNKIKLANLGKGEYVSKGKYESLNEQISGKNEELQTANKLIEELKKSNKNNENIQEKVKQYENEVKELQQKLEETKIKSAVKVALLSEKAIDVDYLTFKLNEKLCKNSEVLELDEAGNIKNWNNKITELKTAYPNMFNTALSGSDKKIVDVNKLQTNTNNNSALTKNELLNKSYAERAKIAQENPELYNEVMNSNK